MIFAAAGCAVRPFGHKGVLFARQCSAGRLIMRQAEVRRERAAV